MKNNSSSAPKKRGRGRPRYEPSEADRNTVKALAINHTPHETICKCLGHNGVDLKTMYKYFRDELDHSLDRANAAIISRAYKMALEGNPPAATFFWLKCKAGWQEKIGIEHSGEVAVKRLEGVPLGDV